VNPNSKKKVFDPPQVAKSRILPGYGFTKRVNHVDADVD